MVVQSECGHGPASTSDLVDVLDCQQLCPNDVLHHLNDPLQSSLNMPNAAGVPCCNAACTGYSPLCTGESSREGSAAAQLPQEIEMSL